MINRCECEVTEPDISICMICTKDTLIVKVNLGEVAVDMIVRQFPGRNMDEITEIKKALIDK